MSSGGCWLRPGLRRPQALRSLDGWSCRGGPVSSGRLTLFKRPRSPPATRISLGAGGGLAFFFFFLRVSGHFFRSAVITQIDRNRDRPGRHSSIIVLQEATPESVISVSPFLCIPQSPPLSVGHQCLRKRPTTVGAPRLASSLPSRTHFKCIRQAKRGEDFKDAQVSPALSCAMGRKTMRKWSLVVSGPKEEFSSVSCLHAGTHDLIFV